MSIDVPQRRGCVSNRRRTRSAKSCGRGSLASLVATRSGRTNRSAEKHLRRRILRSELLEPRQLLAAGDPDLGFGTNGIAAVPIFGDPLTFRPVAADQTADGKTVVLASRSIRSFFGNISIEPVVARFDDNGVLDPTFSDIGYVNLDLTRLSTGGGVRDVEVDDEGFIYLLRDTGNTELIKLKPDGSRAEDFDFDPDFPRSVQAFDLSPTSGVSDDAVALQLDAQGRIYIASVATNDDASVTRVLPNGSLDPTFGSEGIATIDVDTPFEIGDLRVADDGTVFVSGYLGATVSVVALAADGTQDTGFGADGIVTLPVPTRSATTLDPLLELDGNGNLVVAGRSLGDIVVGRLDSSGALDPTFDTDGLAIVDNGGTDTLSSLAIDSGGQILLGIQTGGDANVIRLSDNGAPAGATGDLFPADSNNRVLDLGPTADGGMVALTGLSIDSSGFGDASLVRIDGMLQRVAGYGSGGDAEVMFRSELDFEAFGNSTAPTTKVLADDSVLLVGPDEAVKVLADGSRDTSYGDNGVSQPGQFLGIARAIVEPDGSYVNVGGDNSTGGYEFYAVNASGQPDLTFGVGGQIEDDGSDQAVLGFRDAIPAAGGGFYVLGDATSSLVAESLRGFYVTKYTAAGQRDATFGTGGVMLIAPAAGQRFFGMRLQVDGSGNLVILGTQAESTVNFSPGELVIAKVSAASGQPVAGFGSSGVVRTGTFVDRVTSAAVDSDGSVVVATDVDDVTTIRRFESDGSVRQAFGFNGEISLNSPTLNANRFDGEIAIDVNGNLLIPSSGRAAYEVIRLTSTGQIDLGFGDFGVASIPLISEIEARPEIDFDSQGRIVSGAVYEPEQFGLERPLIARFENGDSACPAAGCIRLDESFPIVEESDGQATITIVRERGSTGPATVRLRTLLEREVEAVPGEDYTPVDTIVSFADGQTLATVIIPIVADAIDEAPDTILIEISEPTGGALLENPQRARLTITRQGPNPIALDASFGTEGTSSQSFGNLVPLVRDSLELPDGRIVVVGSDDVDDGDFLIARYLADGSPDVSFSNDGLLRLDFQFERERADSVALLSDGSLIVAGESNFSVDAGVGQPRGTLLKVLPDGAVDTSFGIDGRVVSEDLEIQGFTDVITLADDSMYVLAETRRIEPDPDDPDINLEIFGLRVQKRFADGTLDVGFGTDGEATISGARVEGSNGIGIGDAMAIDANGRLIVAGSALTAPDPTFPTQISLRPFVAAVLPSGSLDPTFGSAGRTFIDGFPTLRVLNGGIAIDPAGNVLLAVTSDDDDGPVTIREDRAGVVRILPNGTLDTNFGDAGLTSIRVPFRDTVPLGITLTPNGRIWMPVAVEGNGIVRQTLGIMSFLPDGRPDPAIEGVGFQITDTPIPATESGSALTLAGGEVLFAGVTSRFEVNPLGVIGGLIENQVTLIKVAGGEGPGEIEFTVSAVEVDENAGEVLLQISRSNGGQGRASVFFQTRSGSATAGTDFVSSSGEVLFEDSVTIQTISIPLIDAEMVEGEESFFVDLTNPTGGAALGSNTVSEVTIFDGPGQIGFQSPTFASAENQNSAVIVLTRTGGTDGVVDVRVRTTGGSASVGGDYLAIDQVVTFADGQETAVVSLELIDDNLTEGIETVELELSDPTGGATISLQGDTTLRLFDVEPFQATTAGAFDLTFGGDGRVRALSVPDSNVNDGFFVAPIGMANVANGSFVVADQFFRVSRVRSDGSLDTGFGDQGIASIVVPSIGRASQRAEGFTVDGQGRFLLVGRRSLGTESDMVVVRYLPNGDVDTSFGTDGVAIVDAAGDDRGFAVTVDAMGSVYVAGSSGGLLSRDQVVAKLTPDGVLDTGFGAQGIVRLPAQRKFEEATALLIQDDGSVVVAGHSVSILEDRGGVPISSSDVVIVRLNPSGALDGSFGDAGKATLDVADRTGNVSEDDRVRQLLATDDGGFLVVGAVDGEFLVAKRTADGMVDTAFGNGDGYTSGVVSAGGPGGNGLDFANDAVIGPDGNITVVGKSERGNELAVIRLLPNGLPDPTFGVRGTRFFTNVDFAFGGNQVIRAEQGGLLIANEIGEIIKLTETTVCPPEGCLQFSTIDNSVRENGRTIQLRVSRPSSNTEGVATVEYFTVNGTAEAGSDYEVASGTLTFGDNESSATLTINISDDSLSEGEEQFFVVLAAPTGGAALGAQFVVPVVIEDNEQSAPLPAFVSVRSRSFAEDSGTANVPISIFGNRDEIIELDYVTVPVGSAEPGVDYIPVSGTLIFGTNVTSASIPVPIILDDEIEANETFQVVITGLSGARLGSSTATVTIVDIDPTICVDGPGTPHPEFGESDGLTRVSPQADGNPNASGADGPIFTHRADDGRVVQVGTIEAFDTGVSVVRYLADGTRDASFGDNGVARIETVQNGGVQIGSFDGSELPEAVRLLPDGRVLVIGQAFDGPRFSLFVMRLTASGQLDATFGNGGFLFTEFSNAGVLVDEVLLDDSGGFLIQGTTGVQWRADEGTVYDSVVARGTSTPIGFLPNFRSSTFIARVGADGQFDSSFGGDGSILFSNGEQIRELQFDSAGGILLTRSIPETVFGANELIRFNADGSLDGSFGDAGSFVPQSPPAPDLVLPDGFVPSDLVAETGFESIPSSNGDHYLLGTTIYSVTDPDSGFPAFLGSQTFVSRYSPDWQLRTDYGDDGFASASFFEFGLSVRDLAVQPDGRLLVVGNAFGQVAAVRFRPDGQLDRGFGGTGLQRVPGTSPGFGEITIVEAADDRTILSYRDVNQFALLGLTSGPSVGAVRLGRSNIQVAEDGGSLEVLVRRVCGVDGAISVDISTMNGSAVAGADYGAVSQTVSFADGEFEKFVSIPIIDNQQTDGDRQFTITLNNPTGGAEVLTVPTSTVTIVDDEQPGRIQFVATPISVDETAGTVTVELERIDGDGGSVSVRVTPSGTATAGEDYQFDATTVTFGPGVQSRSIEIPIIDDDVVENPRESLRLTLSNPTGGSELGFVSTIGVEIRDDDVLRKPVEGTFSISTPQVQVDESAGTATFTITRTDGTDGAVTVRYAALDPDATATEGRDFSVPGGVLNFADGQETRSIEVPIFDDALIEGNESFSLQLTSVSAGRLSDDEVAASVTIVDNDAVEILLDLGDAPDTYATTLIAGGPIHPILEGFTLGSQVTSEPDAIASDQSDSDSADDGIAGLAAPLVAGTTATIDVTVNLIDDFPRALVQGWIDFNRDGQFTDDEQVISNQLFTQSGTQSVAIDVPTDAVSGTSHARFRLSTLASLAPTGSAPDGEVEDYAVVISGEVVENTPPMIEAGGPYFVNEGSDLSLTAVGMDAEDGTNLTYDWDLSVTSGFVFDTPGATVTTGINFDPPPLYIVAVRATDRGGLVAVDTATVTVNNLPPIIAADSPSVDVAPGATATLHGDFSDPGNDPVLLTASVGTVLDAGGGRFTWNGPSTAGIVTITATDDDEASSTTTFQVNEVMETCSTIVTTTADSGRGSLREAIGCSNVTPGVDTISFQIPMGSQIAVQSALPDIIDRVVIQGLFGANDRPAVTLDGIALSRSADDDGLVIAAEGRSIIDAIAIVNFPGDGLDVAETASIELTRSHLGVSPNDFGTGGNDGFGVLLRGSGSVIGGAMDSGNRIGNNEAGVVLLGSSSDANDITHNEIGVTRGATGAGFGNRMFGVYIDGGSGNHVTDNSIGGSDDGVRVVTGRNNRMESNEYVGVSAQEIDLGINGSTPNDVGDLDEGANRLINTPVLAFAANDFTSYTASLTFDSPASRVSYPVTVQVYNVSNGGTVLRPLTSLTFNGPGTRELTFAVNPSIPSRISAISIDAMGNTSEFADSLVLRPATGGSVPWIPGVDPLNPRAPIVGVGEDDRIEEPGDRIEIGAINRGIAVADDATGVGYILYSVQAVADRFSPAPLAGNSAHLIAVQYTSGQWTYNDNQQWIPFTPEAGDRLIAAVDFDADTITGLSGASGQVAGIDRGYQGGDLTFHADRWNRRPNDGEFTIRGTSFEPSSPMTAPTLVEVGPVGRGIAVQDDATGSGFIMYSEQSVFQRFMSSSPLPGNSDHFIAVRHTGGQWMYNDNQQWIPFDPTLGDRLIAAVDFDADQIVSLQGMSGRFEGIDRGFQDSDLVFSADRWAGRPNDGEFQIRGSYFVVPPPPVPGEVVSLGAINRGIAVQDSAVGLGFILHSREPVAQRFGSSPPFAGNSKHLIAVQFTAGQWFYNDNQQWIVFTPAADDRLIAAVDFDADTITSLQDQEGEFEGIQQGYLNGDLSFAADRWNGRHNDGEFVVSGTFFQPSLMLEDPVPAMASMTYDAPPEGAPAVAEIEQERLDAVDEVFRLSLS